MKYSEDYVAFGFTFFTDSDGSERPQCFLCGKVLSNTSLKPAKLKEHLTSSSSSSFCVMAVSALDVLRWIAIKFGFVQFPIIQYGV